MASPANWPSHAIHSRHVGSFFALSGIRKSHKLCSHSLLLNLHKAKVHPSNNIINIYSLTTSLTCSNKISRKLKHILLFFLGFSYTAPRKKYPTWRRHEVHTGCVVKTLYRADELPWCKAIWFVMSTSTFAGIHMKNASRWLNARVS